MENEAYWRHNRELSDLLEHFDEPLGFNRETSVVEIPAISKLPLPRSDGYIDTPNEAITAKDRPFARAYITDRLRRIKLLEKLPSYQFVRLVAGRKQRPEEDFYDVDHADDMMRDFYERRERTRREMDRTIVSFETKKSELKTLIAREEDLTMRNEKRREIEKNYRQILNDIQSNFGYPESNNVLSLFTLINTQDRCNILLENKLPRDARVEKSIRPLLEKKAEENKISLTTLLLAGYKRKFIFDYMIDVNSGQYREMPTLVKAELGKKPVKPRLLDMSIFKRLFTLRTRGEIVSTWLKEKYATLPVDFQQWVVDLVVREMGGPTPSTYLTYDPQNFKKPWPREVKDLFITLSRHAYDVDAIQLMVMNYFFVSYFQERSLGHLALDALAQNNLSNPEYDNLIGLLEEETTTKIIDFYSLSLATADRAIRFLNETKLDDYLIPGDFFQDKITPDTLNRYLETHPIRDWLKDPALVEKFDSAVQTLPFQMTEERLYYQLFVLMVVLKDTIVREVGVEELIELRRTIATVKQQMNHIAAEVQSASSRPDTYEQERNFVFLPENAGILRMNTILEAATKSAYVEMLKYCPSLAKMPYHETHGEAAANGPFMVEFANLVASLISDDQLTSPDQYKTRRQTDLTLTKLNSAFENLRHYTCGTYDGKFIITYDDNYERKKRQRTTEGSRFSFSALMGQ